MTDDEMELEFEMDLAAEGEALKKCPQCGFQTHRKACLYCKGDDGRPLTLYGDEEYAEAMTRIEAGEEVDIDKIFKQDDFVPLKPGEMP